MREDGGRFYRRIGVSDEVRIPPSGNDVSALTEEQRQFYDMSSEEDLDALGISAQQELDLKANQAAPVNTCSSGVQAIIGLEDTGAAPTQPQISPLGSPSFSGYMVDAESGPKFAKVSGSIDVPSVQSAGCSNSALASWVGFGGGTGQPLAQVGLIMKPGLPPAAFYEYMDSHGVVAGYSSGQRLTSETHEIPISLAVPILESDTMTFQVKRDASGRLGFHAYLFRGGLILEVKDVYVDDSHGDYYEPSRAAFIDERPMEPSGRASLPRFSDIYWHYLYVDSPTGARLDFLYTKIEPVTMLTSGSASSSPTVLAQPSQSASSLPWVNAFTDRWFRCS
ncbi:MAG: hypothetical protein EBS41_00560 [Actinobacteria bacterium]|nr:hypothetical protein [Actinomycetota bacterium]